MSMLIAKAMYPETKKTKVDEDLHAVTSGCTLVKRSGASFEVWGEGGFSELLDFRKMNPDFVIRLPNGLLYPYDVER